MSEIAVSIPARRRISYVALVATLLALTFVVFSTHHTWTLTDGAILSWRLRVILPDLIGGGLVAIGCALATFGSPRGRRFGWNLATLVFFSFMIWIIVVTAG